MSTPAPIVLPPPPRMHGRTVGQPLPGGGVIAGTPTPAAKPDLAAQQLQDEAAAAAVMRAAQKQAAAEDARRAQDKAEQDMRTAALAEQLRQMPVMDLSASDQDIFAEAERELGGGAPEAADPVAEAIGYGAFDPDEALGGGVASTWGYGDALNVPLLRDSEVGCEWRLVTQTADGHHVIRRYFDLDPVVYERRIQSMNSMSLVASNRAVMPQMSDHNIVATPHGANAYFVAYSYDAWEAERRHATNVSERPKDAAAQLAQAIAGSGVNGSILELAMRNGDRIAKVASTGKEDSPIPSAPVGAAKPVLPKPMARR